MLQMDCCGRQCQGEPFLAVAYLPHTKFWFLYHDYSYPEDVGECCHRVVRRQNHDPNGGPLISV
jgi:hypothetical protein